MLNFLDLKYTKYNQPISKYIKERFDNASNTARNNINHVHNEMDSAKEEASKSIHSRQKRCKKFKFIRLLPALGVRCANGKYTINHFLLFCSTVLGLFNLIQFENSRCNSTDSDKQGVCYTSSECRGRGGTAKGNCASGFGVCCLCK